RDSETRLRLIVESALDYAIFSVDLNGTVISWNNGAEQMFGFNEPEIVGKSGDLIFTDEDRAAGAPVAELKQAREKGVSRDDRWHQRKDGTRLFVSGVVRPMFDEAGSLMGFIKIARDVTERLRADERLRAEKEFSEKIINSLPGVFYLIEESGRFRLWNVNLEHVSGYSRDEISQRTPFDFFEGEDHQRIARAFRDVVENGQSTVEAEIISKDGRRIPHLFFGCRISLENRTCVMGMGVDISERKRAEEDLRKAQEQLRGYTVELEHHVAERTAHLRQSLQSLEGLLYHVAHDLRAPLRAMASFTKILLDDYADKLDEKAKDYAQRISKSAHFMDELVQDLLAYGRLTHSEVHLSKVNLELQVDAALNRFAAEIRRKNAQMEVQRPMPWVSANTAVLNEIITHLISNALKFTPDGKPPRIRICSERNAATTRLWVEDNGIGIKPEYHERIFRMFERLHGGDAYPGTGIGLAIVAKGAERMGGKAGVESRPGEGSRFWIELPGAG
ncbi:MAG TPA: PAS domain S-box protein, partial [Candidatus Paceibacterota bacterium]|nr:PAS domain S-box protein [Candidatus Paceibacterota bacterium]